jgi:hypothetical protein
VLCHRVLPTAEWMAAQLRPRVILPHPDSSAAVPHGTKDTVALTVRLDQERYRRLVAYAAGFMPRKTHQDILVEALDAYLDRVVE